jgi:hypothetical protein
MEGDWRMIGCSFLRRMQICSEKTSTDLNKGSFHYAMYEDWEVWVKSSFLSAKWHDTI